MSKKVLLFIILFSICQQCKTLYDIELENGLSYTDINKTNSLGKNGLWIHTLSSLHLPTYQGHQIGNYKNDYKEGLWQEFFKDDLRIEANFKLDELEGNTFIYKKGKIEYQLILSKGKLHGTSRYFKQGKLIESHTYERDELIKIKCHYKGKCDLFAQHVLKHVKFVRLF